MPCGIAARFSLLLWNWACHTHPSRLLLTFPFFSHVMNRLKLTLVILGGLAALVLLMVILAFTSSVQTWAVRRALTGQPGLTMMVGSVAAGLTSAEIRDVRVEQDGVIIVAQRVSATYSAMDYISGRRITIENVAVKGLEIDARKPSAKQSTAPAQVALAPFAGILNSIKIPGEMSLGRLDVDAKVQLPGNQSATLTLSGGGLTPGKFATITWKAAFSDVSKGAPLTAAQASGEIKLRTTADLRVDAVEFTGDVSATGPSLPSDRLKVEVKLAQVDATSGETISARVGLVRGANVEPLFNTQVTYAAGKPTLSGTWGLAVRSEQLAAVLSGFGLPEVALAGEGSFTFNLETSAATATGTLNGQISKLEKLGAELAAIGTLQIRAVFDGGSGKDSAQLGKLEFAVAGPDGRTFVTVAAQQKLSFTFKDQRLTAERPGAELLRVALIGVPLAWAQPVLKPRTITSGELAGVFVVGAELDGSRIKLSTVEPLTLRSVTVREGQGILVDRVTVALSPRVDYSAARIMAELEKISVSTGDGDSLAGSVSADLLTGPKPATTFSAQLEGKIAALVKPYLPAEVGPLTLALKAQGRLEGNALQLSALKLQIDREGGVVLAAIDALQPLALDVSTKKISAPQAAAPAARVRWGEIPLGWVEPYVAQSKMSGQLVAGALEITLPGGEAIGVRATEKIATRNMSVALSGQDYLRGADFATDLNATWTGTTLTAAMRQLELRQGSVALVSVAVAGDVTPGKALRATGKGTVSADFAALAKQPALAAHLPLLRGTVNVTFDGAMADGVTGKVSISAQNLVAREGALALGAMDLAIDAKLDATHSGTVRNTLIVTKDGRKSDITLDGKIGVKPGAISFEGRVTGDQLIVDDLQAFAALGAQAPSSAPKSAELTPAPAPRRSVAAPAAPTPKLTGPVKDTAPVWAGFTGRVDLNIKAIKLDAATTLGDLRGALAIREDRLAVETVSGKLNGNPFKISTLLSFDPKLARPYALAGTVEVPGFDVGAFLRKADPSAPPALETTFTIASKFNGTAANLPEFADRIQGQLDFKGSKGVLRALNKKSESASLGIGLAGLGAALLGQQKLAAGLNSAAELAQLMKDMPFDGIVVQVERGADAAIVVKSIEVLSPMMRLTGTGRIDAKPGVPFATSPLALNLQLAAKGQLANGLNQARQLDGKTDAKGYYLMATPFALAGTVEKPDSSDFWKNLTLNTASGFLR